MALEKALLCKKKEYANTKPDDAFLVSLIEGGCHVWVLSRGLILPYILNIESN